MILFTSYKLYSACNITTIISTILFNASIYKRKDVRLHHVRYADTNYLYVAKKKVVIYTQLLFEINQPTNVSKYGGELGLKCYYWGVEDEILNNNKYISDCDFICFTKINTSRSIYIDYFAY